MHAHVYLDDDGVTRFGPLDLSTLHAAGATLRSATLFDARPPGAMQDWHNAVVPMFIITLRGHMEVEIEGGHTRTFGPGDVRFTEDVTGPGHVTRVLGDEPWEFAVVMLTSEG